MPCDRQADNKFKELAENLPWFDLTDQLADLLTDMLPD
jgi:hypothetical protein